MGTIRVKVNERWEEVEEGSTPQALRDRFKPEADLVICNGFPQSCPAALRDGDEIVLIRRGEMPPREELESLMMARHTPGVHEKVRVARVGIAGLGGLGSSVAVALARVGVGTLVIADYDVVEPSNLNRQQYFIDQIGKNKVDAMMENLRRINPDVKIEAHRVRLNADNVPEIFADADVIAECFDNAQAKQMIVETVLSKMGKTVIVAVSGLAGYGNSNAIQTRRISDKLILVGDETTGIDTQPILTAARVGIAACHQANAIIEAIMESKK